MTCGLQNMCQCVCPSSPLPLCEMAMLKITSRHICSYSKRAAEMGGRRALQQLTVAYKVHFAVHLFHGQRFRHATTAYFPPADMNSFCLSASVRGPRMQLCVRRWKFWNCVILNTMTYACLSQEKKNQSWAIRGSRVRHFWKPFSGREWYFKKKKVWIVWPTYEQIEENLEWSQWKHLFVPLVASCMSLQSYPVAGSMALIEPDSLSKRMFQGKFLITSKSPSALRGWVILELNTKD